MILVLLYILIAHAEPFYTWVAHHVLLTILIVLGLA